VQQLQSLGVSHLAFNRLGTHIGCASIVRLRMQACWQEKHA